MGNNARLEELIRGWYGHGLSHRDRIGSSGFVMVPAGMCLGYCRLTVTIVV